MGILTVSLLASGTTTATGTFCGRAWSINVPVGYHRTSAAPDERMSTTAFAPGPRADGTRPMVQVTLIDTRETSGTRDFRRKVAESLIAGVQRRREEWQVQMSEARVGDMPVFRYVWRGVTVPASDGASVRVAAQGVMLVGVKDGLAFALHTQDVDAHAAETIPANEAAMVTFRLTSVQAGN